MLGVCVVVLLLWKSTKGDRGSFDKNNNDVSPQPRKHKLRGSGLIDDAFWKNVKKLIKVAIPNYTCKEFKYLITLTLLLVLRTQMSIWLADINGKVVKAIVEKNFKKFCFRIFNLMLFAIPSSAVNSGMDYFSKLMAVGFRERLTKYFHDAYLQQMFYYKICNLDSRI